MTLRTPTYLIAGLIPLAILVTGLVVSSKEVLKFYFIDVIDESYTGGWTDEDGKFHKDIRTIMKDIPFVPPMPKFKKQQDALIYCTGASLCFFMLYTILPLVFEKEKKLKYALNVMGCRLYPYWFGNFLFDCIYLFLYIVIFIVLGVTLEGLPIVKESIGEWIVLLVFCSISVLCLSYLFSLRYESSGQVQKYGLWVILLIFFGLPLAYVAPLTR